jgi:hypothetical protein
VHLVDDDEPRAYTDDRHDLVVELRVRQPFGRDQDEVDGVLGERLLELSDGRRARRVHRHRTRPEPSSSLDLVAHEGEEWRDEQRRTETALAEQRRCEEVDRALYAPTRRAATGAAQVVPGS